MKHVISLLFIIKTACFLQKKCVYRPGIQQEKWILPGAGSLKSSQEAVLALCSYTTVRPVGTLCLPGQKKGTIWDKRGTREKKWGVNVFKIHDGHVWKCSKFGYWVLGLNFWSDVHMITLDFVSLNCDTLLAHEGCFRKQKGTRIDIFSRDTWCFLIPKRTQEETPCTAVRVPARGSTACGSIVTVAVVPLPHAYRWSQCKWG